MERKPHKTHKPSFLWDYDLDESEIRKILHAKDLSPEKRWLIERLLGQARFDEVMQYLSLEEIRKFLPILHLPFRIKQRWEYALKRWFPHD